MLDCDLTSAELNATFSLFETVFFFSTRIDTFQMHSNVFQNNMYDRRELYFQISIICSA